MKKMALLGTVFGASALLLASCGGGTSSTSGTVSFYLTDAIVNGNNQTPQRVDIQIKSISIANSQSGKSCEVFNSGSQPYTTDLTDLAQSMRLLNVTNCEAGTYDRFVIVMSQSVNVMLNNTDYSCSMDPQMVEESDTQVTCNNGECVVIVGVEDGGMNISEGQNDVSLDFEIEDGDGDGRAMKINIDNTKTPPECRVAFEIEEIEPEEMETHKNNNNKEIEIAGKVGDIDNTKSTFSLEAEPGQNFTVDFSQVNQTGIAEVLNLAQRNNLKVEAECSNFDLGKATCIASEIELKLKAKALTLDITNKTAEIDIDGDGTKDIDIKFSKAEGNMGNGSIVEVEITGYDSNTGQYQADEVEKSRI